MNWYLEVLKKYTVFTGRAERQEFWYFILFNIIVTIVLTALDGVTGTYSTQTGMGLLSGIYTLAVFLPSLAVSIRRLHDTNRSGWWILLSFIPLLGAIVLIVFFAQEGFPGDNQYGSDPKGALG